MAALPDPTEGATYAFDGRNWNVIATETQVIRRGVDQTVTITDEFGNEVETDGTVIREELQLHVKLNPA